MANGAPGTPCRYGNPTGSKGTWCRKNTNHTFKVGVSYLNLSDQGPQMYHYSRWETFAGVGIQTVLPKTSKSNCLWYTAWPADPTGTSSPSSLWKWFLLLILNPDSKTARLWATCKSADLGICIESEKPIRDEMEDVLIQTSLSEVLRYPLQWFKSGSW